jgi:hypothetical protein
LLIKNTEGFCLIEDQDMISIAKSLKKNTCIQELVFDSEIMSVHGYAYLAEALNVNSSIHTLKFCKGLPDEGIQIIFGALKDNSTLLNLILHNSEQSLSATESFQANGEALKVNSSLKELFLVNFALVVLDIRTLSLIICNLILLFKL